MKPILIRMTRDSRPWFEFAVKDLILGLALIAIGIAGIAWLVSVEVTGWAGQTIGVQFIHDFAALIGAGLLSPFRRKTLGAVLGFVGVAAMSMIWGNESLLIELMYAMSFLPPLASAVFLWLVYKGRFSANKTCPHCGKSLAEDPPTSSV